ncbi:hypothetical protein ACHWQZ_G015054 [Mnemiopsis leidyi]
MRSHNLFLQILLSVFVLKTHTKEVEAYIDGRKIMTLNHLHRALGWYGVDLLNLGFHQTHRNVMPQTIRIRARDIRNSRHLQNSAVGYLLNFGYLEMVMEKSEIELLDLDYFIDQDDLNNALREVQQFHGLRVTGRPTVETQILMMRSRCGEKDVGHETPNMVENPGTYRSQGESVNSIKYWLDPEKYTADLPREVVRREVEKSLILWSTAAGISFVEVRDEEDAHVKIRFETRDHRDGNQSYGPGGSYLHISGRSLHFDDEERFTADTSYGINLQYAISHGIGHVLGIKHLTASSKNALMYPIYRGYGGVVELEEVDKAAAVRAVGAGEGSVQPIVEEDVGPSVTPTSESTTTVIQDTPPECIEKIDAAFHWPGDQEAIFIFVGSWFYRLARKSPELGNSLPVLDNTEPAGRIGIDGFNGLPRKIDAAVMSLENPNDLYVFKMSTFYLYDMILNRVVDKGPLSKLWPDETPNKIDGAVKIDTQTLGFLVGDRLYEYQSNTREWKVGCDGSNYFRKFRGLDALTVGFIDTWTWIFQGAEVEAYIDGKKITTSNHLHRALGWYGVDLLNLGFHQTHRNVMPQTIRIRARDIRNSRHLQNSAVGYLLNFGYLEMVMEKSEIELLDLDYFIDQDVLNNALREVQQFHGLRVTGRPTVETQTLMMRSRCGEKDVGHETPNMAENPGTYRSQGESVNGIKYWLDPEKYTADLPREVVRREVEKSLILWSRAAGISFVEVRDEETAHVKIRFETRDHKDGNQSYGPGGSYLHISGRSLHFDDEERFTADTSYGINLQYAISHGIGHVLGIKHLTASSKNALMYPIYRGYDGVVELEEVDKAAAVRAVGAGEGSVQPIVEEDVGPSVTPTSESTTTVIQDTPPECIEKIDAAFHWPGDQEAIFIFVGSWFYRLARKSPELGNILPVLDDTEPAGRIGIDGFNGLPRKIDAAVMSLENPNDLYVFKMSTFYLYDMILNRVVDKGPLSKL